MKNKRLVRGLLTWMLGVCCSVAMVFPAAADAYSIFDELKVDESFRESVAQNDGAQAAKAEEEAWRIAGLLLSDDGNGNLTGLSPAVAFSLGDDAIVWANSDVCTEKSSVYTWMTAEGDTYEVAGGEAVEEYDVFAALAKGEGDNACIAEMDSAHQGERAYLAYFSDDYEEFKLCYVETEEAYSFDDSLKDYDIYVALLEVAGVPEQGIAFPAAILNGDGSCIGIAFGQTHVRAFHTTEESFYGASSATTTEPVTESATEPAAEPTTEPTTKPAAAPTTAAGAAEPEPAPGPGAESDSSKYFMIIIILILAIVLVRSFSSKKNSGQASAAQEDLGTISLGDERKPDGGVKLVGIGGYMDGRVFPVGSHEITFGRDPSCSVIYPGDTKGISRIHCKLFWQNGTLMLMDMNSSYGTYTESGKLAPMSPLPLHNGEVFYLAEKTNCFKVQY